MRIKKFDFYILNIISLFIYFLVFFNLAGTGISDEIMFITPDSREYLAVSTEFFDFSANTLASSTRPLLYPFVIYIFYGLFGAWGLWAIQFLFWISAINLIFSAVVNFTKNRTLGFVAAFVTAINVSLIVLSRHALTEVFVAFLLSLFIYFLTKNFKEKAAIQKYYICLFLLVLLTISKPVFFWPVIFLLLVLLPILFIKKYLLFPRDFLICILIVLPLIFQMGLMKIRFDTFSVSRISMITVKAYWLSQGVSKTKNISIEEARAEVMDYSTKDALKYISQNKKLYFGLLLGNMKKNIDALTSFWASKNGKHPYFSEYMSKTNLIYFILHILFLLLTIWAIVHAFSHKRYNYFLFFLGLLLLIYYIFVTSGISFWQGDRLVVYILPLWVFLYSCTVFYLSNRNSFIKE